MMDPANPQTFEANDNDRRVAELDAENRRMREALEDIAVYGCGMLNQPATLNEPVETWLRRRIREYERRARAALSQEEKP